MLHAQPRAAAHTAQRVEDQEGDAQHKPDGAQPLQLNVRVVARLQPLLDDVRLDFAPLHPVPALVLALHALKDGIFRINEFVILKN